jgi:hypothetical protein
MRTIAGVPYGLEESRAQIEAITGEDQRHGQTYSTKNSERLDRFDISLSSRHARKRSCEGSHLRSPWLDPNIRTLHSRAAVT